MPASTRRRASPLLFKWEPLEFGLDSTGNPWALSGNRVVTGTFDRGGTVGAASSVDVNGRVFTPGYKTPRSYHPYDATTGLFLPRGILLEGARTNLVVQSDTLTAGAGWTVSGTATPTAAYSNIGATSFTRITGIAAGAGNIQRSVTLTGDGVKACSAVVQFDVAGTQVLTLLYDNTAGAQRCTVTVTWASDGTATCVANTGTLLLFQRLQTVSGASTYGIVAQSTSATAANAHRCYPVSSVVGGTADSARIGGCQVEDATFPSSIIPTVGSTVTRSADALSFPFNAATQALTVYCKGVERGGSLVAASGMWEVGQWATYPALMSYRDGANGTSYWHNSGTQVGGAGVAAPTNGQSFEERITLNASGVTQYSLSIEGAAEATGAASSAAALTAGALFGGAVIRLGLYTGGSYGFPAISSLRVAAGVQTMATMRTL